MAARRKAPGKGLAPIEFGKGLAAPSGKWAEQLANDAKEQASREHGDAKYISTQGGAFSFNGSDLPDTLRAVILESAFENSFYNNEPWDPDNMQSPYCSAVGVLEDDLIPGVNSVEPQAQNCEECPQGQFGSSTTGSKKGKACGNKRRLALLSISSDGEPTPIGLAEEEIAGLRIPPTSLRNYRDYVKKLSTSAGLPPYAAVTDITIVASRDNQFEIIFEPVSSMAGSDELMEVVMARRGECAEDIIAPFEKRDAPEKPLTAAQKRKAAADAKKAAAKPRGGAKPKY